MHSTYTESAGQGLKTISNSPQKELQVPVTLRLLESAVSSAHSLLNELEVRLIPVSRIEPPKPSNDRDIKVEQPPNTVYNIVGKNSQEIQKLNDRLQDILRLLEV